jgi:tetratricopeptide (TPR) repeat protein
MLKRNLLITFLFLTQLLPAQKAKITVETRDILTYPYSDPNPVPILAERRDVIYPYHSFNGYSPKGEMKKWEVIKLENDYIEVYVMPTDGGKVWGAIEKSTGKEFVYRNEVMKYRNISMRGPWTSGGIEFNFGYIGHHPSTFVPVDYKIVENEDGSVSCFVGSLDLPSRTKWSVEIRVPKDRAYFETKSIWTNPTPLPQSYYNWMTSSAVVSDDLEFAYPGNQEIGHGGEHGLWPVDGEGRNIAMYKENNFGGSKSYHVVGEYNDFMGGYWHNSKFGFGHWALYDEMPGQKLWLWSLARDGGIWEDLLTDSDGQYMEIQAGRLLNQYGGSSNKTPITQVPFMPGVTDRWHEIWFPVKEIGGLVAASPMGVLNAKAENGKLNFGVNSLSFSEGTIIVKSGGKTIFSEKRKFKPMEVFNSSIPLAANAGYEIIVEGMDLKYNPDKKAYISRPFISTMPTDQVTAASLYQEGMELKENRAYKEAKPRFMNCLKKDPLYTDAMAALTELYYRSIQYDSALYYANQALMMDTYHPAANYYAGITYKATGNMVDAMESLGWAARSMEYRSTAYAHMAGIQLQLGNNQLTAHYADLALDFNRNNFNALEILTILRRKSGEIDMADKYIQTISTLDPLNHFADFERTLINPSEENNRRLASTITNEMPYQTYLELAMVYYNLGLKDDALLALDKSPSHSLVTLWKAYLKDDASLVNEAASSSPAFVFPYRTETVPVLEWALTKNSSWKFKYYLALNYLAIQRDAEAMDLFRACAQEPDYAPFYLARAALMRPRDTNQQLTDLQKAQTLAPDDWRTTNRLIDYYEANKNSKMALAVSTPAYKKYKDNPSVAVKHAIALINNGQYASSLKVLDGIYILPDEGARQGKVVLEQATLLSSMDLINKKKYSDAIKMIEKSKEWPENLGVGKPYTVDIRVQDYLKAFTLDKMKRSKEAEELRQSVIDFTKDHNDRPSFSNILGIWLMKNKGQTKEADDLIKKLSESGSPVNKWVVAVSKNDQAAVSELEKGFSEDIPFLILKKLIDVTK